MHPDVQFIVAHCIGLEWFAETPAEFPNLNFEISPYWLVSDQRVMHAVKTFGAQHVIFGSDTPFGEENQRNNIQRILDLQLPLSEKRMILGDNMAALLGY
jgi:predicted TIM-barrel fold metal-dependent hydrolase